MCPGNNQTTCPMTVKWIDRRQTVNWHHDSVGVSIFWFWCINKTKISHSFNCLPASFPVVWAFLGSNPPALFLLPSGPYERRNNMKEKAANVTASMKPDAFPLNDSLWWLTSVIMQPWIWRTLKFLVRNFLDNLVKQINQELVQSPQKDFTICTCIWNTQCASFSKTIDTKKKEQFKCNLVSIYFIFHWKLACY